MKKDLQYLKDYKTCAADNLAENLEITREEAIKVLKILEDEDLIRIEAPDINDKPVEILTVDKSIIKSELGMTSHKVGNILLNSYLDWRVLAGIISTSIGIVEGFDSKKPVLIIVGILSSIFSASKIADISIDENGTAIIMALQNRKRHKIYRAAEGECQKEANEILSQNGYSEMDGNLFQETLTKLIAYKCIDNENGILILKERVLLHY